MTALGLSPPVTLINVPNAITAVRTAGSVGLAVAALTHRSAHLLVAAYLVYWIGDILDGAAARALGQETRTGAVFDIVADRACTSACAAAPKPPGRLATILTRPKAAGARLVEVMERPRHATGVLLVSAVTGFPPLLASIRARRRPRRGDPRRRRCAGCSRVSPSFTVSWAPWRAAGTGRGGGCSRPRPRRPPPRNHRRSCGRHGSPAAIPTPDGGRPDAQLWGLVAPYPQAE
jgi:hypothetical protein